MNLTRAAWWTGVFFLAGVVASIAGFVVDPARAALGWLTAFLFVLLAALGSLVLVMIGHATNARWFIVVRRLGELAAATLPVSPLLFVPVALCLPHLYDWADPARGGEHARLLLEHRSSWNDPGAFLVRSFSYFAVWIFLAERLLGGSIGQGDGPWEVTGRLRRLSIAGLWPLALSMTFAGVDWVMALETTWASTMSGVQLFAGAMTSGLAVLVLCAYVGVKSGALGGRVSEEHFYALGRLLLAFVIFWGYIAFAQLLIVYEADLPEEAEYYLRRGTGSWGVLGLLAVTCRLLLPFALLLSRGLKRQPGRLATVAAVVLAGGYVDAAWLVLPSGHAASGPSWIDAGCLAACAGAVVTFGLLRARGLGLLATGDPELSVSARYRSS